MRSGQGVCAWVILGVLLLSCAAMATGQVNSADLSGTVADPSGATVNNAKVTVTFLSTGAVRSATTDESRHYTFLQLTPGRYKLSVDAGADFATLEISDLVLTVGSAATYDAHLQLRTQSQTIVIEGTTALVETQKTEVSQTIDERRIDNLPINGRNYINFTLTNSQTNRDASPSIGAAPTSGLNFGGQRARSNEVSVDGADAVDNSVNGIRATVSQEAVQEFQIILSNYNAEYGRAMGGVVNIVTKGGANDIHGNVFGFLRNKAFQARNPFSVEVDPATGAVNPVKQAYTRVQAGATLGGPIVKDKTFYFFSYETTRRQETGFTNIGANNFGLVPVPGASVCLPTPQLLTGGPSGQAVFYPAAIQAAGGCASPFAAGLIQAAALTGGASAVALFGNVKVGGVPVVPAANA